MEALQTHEENVLKSGETYNLEGVRYMGIMNHRKGIYLGAISDGRIKYPHHLLIRTPAINGWDKDNLGLLRFRDYKFRGLTLIVSSKTQSLAKLKENEKRFYKNLLEKFGL